MPSNRSSSSRYIKEFVSKLRRNCEESSLKDLEDFPGDLYVHEELGLRLYHAGINPFDDIHYRHQLYIVVESKGKASRVCAADTIVANALCLQYSSKRDIVEALTTSISQRGRRVLAGDRISSNNRCGRCGHDTVVTWHREGHLFSPDEYWSTQCCGYDFSGEVLNCCRCVELDEMGTVTPLDYLRSNEMEPSGLPVRDNGNDDMQVGPLTNTPQREEQHNAGNNYYGHTFNVDRMYLALGPDAQMPPFIAGNAGGHFGQNALTPGHGVQDGHEPAGNYLLLAPEDKAEEPLATPRVYEYEEEKKDK